MKADVALFKSGAGLFVSPTVVDQRSGVAECRIGRARANKDKRTDLSPAQVLGHSLHTRMSQLAPVGMV